MLTKTNVIFSVIKYFSAHIISCFHAKCLIRRKTWMRLYSAVKGLLPNVSLLSVLAVCCFYWNNDIDIWTLIKTEQGSDVVTCNLYLECHLFIQFTAGREERGDHSINARVQSTASLYQCPGSLIQYTQTFIIRVFAVIFIHRVNYKFPLSVISPDFQPSTLIGEFILFN